MLSLSNAQLEWVNEGKPINVSCLVTFSDATTETITGDDVESGSFTIDRNCASGQALEIGSAETAELCFRLIDHPRFEGKKFAGAEIVVRYVIAGSMVNAGIFVVDEEPRSLDIIDVRALDRMARFDRPLPFVAFPILASSLLAQICNHCGVEQVISELSNSDYSIEFSEKLNNVTCHQMIGWLAGLFGTNALINELGRLEFKYPVGAIANVDLGDALSLSYAPESVTVTGVEYTIDDTVYLAGQDGYTIDMSDNPLITNDIPLVLNAVLDKWVSYTYQPIESATLMGIPHIFPMDAVSSQNFPYPVLITNHHYSVNGTSEISSAGTVEPVKGYSSGVLTDRERTILASVSKKVAEAINAETVTGFETAVLQLNSEITNALGYYTTTVEVYGKQRVYKHDQSTLEESTYIEYKPEAGSLVWTDTGWNEGEPVWQNGYSKSGSLVMRIISASQINANQVIVEGNKTIVQAMDEQATHNQTLIDNLGVTITENTTIDGETVSNAVATLKADYLSIANDVGNLKTGGGNLLKNSTYGTTTEPSGDWWSEGLTWGEAKLMNIKWGDVKSAGKTWGQAKVGDI